MSSILFSQGPTLHSRIGNSLAWMDRHQGLLSNFKGEYFFPWCIENYQSFLRDESPWLRSIPHEISEQFLQIAGNQLTANALSSYSRFIEDEYEKANGLGAFEWESLCLELNNLGIAYLTCKANSSFVLTKDLLDYYSSRNSIVIIHEPFNMPALSSADTSLKDLLPRNDLLMESCLHIKNLSGNKISVGLHMRRGDYLTWDGGAYYYDDEFWVLGAQKLRRRGLSVWCFGNEYDNQLSEALAAVGAIVSNGTYEQDLTRLMLMSKIYGPPSTFTGMATRLAQEIHMNICYSQIPRKDIFFSFDE